MADWDGIQSGTVRGPGAALVRGAMSAASLGYAFARAAHVALYRLGIRRRVRLPVPVVSVGNLTAGGSGKTPFTAWLAERLLERGRRVAVLARGYGRVSGEALNEEGRWLLQRVEGLRVQQGPDRAAAARVCMRNGDVDVFLLDDGFQHERLERDVDVVLVDATRPFGHGYLLPRGLLREPRSGLARADFVALTRAELVSAETLAALRTEVRALAPAAEVGVVRFPVSAGRGLDPPREPVPLAGRKVFAFTAVGNPQSVLSALRHAGAEVVGSRVLADHHPMPPEEWRLAKAEAADCGAELVVTEKDAMKSRHAESDLRVLVLEQRLEVDGLDALVERIDQRVGGGPPQ